MVRTSSATPTIKWQNAEAAHLGELVAEREHLREVVGDAPRRLVTP